MRNAQQLQNTTTQYASLSHYLTAFLRFYFLKEDNIEKSSFDNQAHYTLNLPSSFGKPGRTEPAKVNNTLLIE